MMQKDYLFFDLDGTLTESAPGIIRSAKYALSHFGITLSDEELHRFIGPPLLESFQNLCGLCEEDSRHAIRLYRSYYEKKGIFENSVYDGVEEMLCRLKKAGNKIAMATSKPEIYAKKIADHYGLTPYFDEIAGAALDHVRMTKSDVLRNAVRGVGLTDMAAGLMIGDRKHDVLGARELGMDTLGVLYGYGSRDELIRAGALSVVSTPAEAADFILSL